VIDRSSLPRLAVPNDARRLREVVDAAYSKYVPIMDRLPAPMVQDLDPDIVAGRVWIVGTPAAALICLRPIGTALLIENVAVHPDHQHRGLGQALLSFAESLAHQLGLDRLQLYTNEVMTHNIALYQHLGYQELDRRSEDGYRRVFMQKTVPSRPG
jgi:GNAT superfamily N-acetyltransferase